MALLRIRSYREFWPFYLQQHADSTCRRLHFIGTSLALISIAGLLLTGALWWLLPLIVGSYGFAWAGHFIFEKNRPATFTYPWWSLISDFRMFGYWVLGRLPDELQRAGVKSSRSNQPLRASR